MPDEAETESRTAAVARRAVSRRRFLQGLGVAGVAAGAGGALIPLTALPQRERALAENAEDEKIAAHQWVMVIDMRRCTNERDCMSSCRKNHYLHEGQEWIKTYTIETHNIEDPHGHSHYMPTLCMHCQQAPCVKVCPVGATFKSPDGATLVDQDRCIGCRMCMAACPYDVRTFNWDDPLPAPNVLGKPAPEYPVPQRKGTVNVCDMCTHNTRNGELPHCVDACPNQAIFVGDLATDLATDGKETVRLSELLQDNDAFRYKEELNTQPRVFYIAGHGQDES